MDPFDCKLKQLVGIGQVELGLNMLPICFDGFCAEAKRVGDLPGPQPPPDHSEDFQFSVGEHAGGRFILIGMIPGHFAEHPRGHAFTEKDLAAQHPAQCDHELVAGRGLAAVSYTHLRAHET